MSGCQPLAYLYKVLAVIRTTRTIYTLSLRNLIFPSSLVEDKMSGENRQEYPIIQ